MEERLYEKLKSYSHSDYYPFHMPGHKRNPKYLQLGDAVQMDITEIDGFDNMHHPEGVIKAAMDRAATLYGADETRYLVNGSSAGNMASILGCLQWKHRQTGAKARLLTAVNCHKSVYHALHIGGYDAIYLEPEVETKLGIFGQIRAEKIADCLERYDDIGAVIITSPTYEGIVSDISAIAEVVHAHHLPLIVDEAHGAHLGFDPHFPQSAITLGADLVIQSMHKTLPSFTQTALLHMQGKEAPWREDVLQYYHYLQTSSPSYVMMAGMDQCISLLECEGQDLFEAYAARLTQFLLRCREFKYVRILRHPRQDMSKLVVFLEPVRACGKWLYDLLLNRYHLQMEMASRDYVLAMTSICDTDEGFERLYRALAEIDRMDMPTCAAYPVYVSTLQQTEDTALAVVPEQSVRTAALGSKVSVSLDESPGRLAAEFAYIYPPGVPILIPGVRITQQAVALLKTYRTQGFVIEGLRDPDGIMIDVVEV